MKFLLTSSGLTNKSISKALFDLVGKELNDTIIAFIPTASNVEMGNKEWFIKDLNNIYKHTLCRYDLFQGIFQNPDSIFEGIQI